MSGFKLVSDFVPKGSQPQAIKELLEGLNNGYKFQTLLGVTGSGKTFTMANVIAGYQKPTLVIAHNKTLAAQLYSEFKEFFPYNAVEYFVSYYDYYQPEAYIPQTDTYIEKDSSINEEIDRLRHSTTQSLLSRRDVIVVASVSCIYNLGSPAAYLEVSINLKKGEKISLERIKRKLVDMQYERNDLELTRGKFRARGDILQIYPKDQDILIQIEFWGDEIEKISYLDPLTYEKIREEEEVRIFPATHFVSLNIEEALKNIEEELKERVEFFKKNGRLLEAQRLEQRTKFDMEMIRELGYCNGIENYSRHFDGRKPGEPPCTLLSYFPDDFLLFIDESHVTIPQIRGMYEGDKSRKDSLVEYGFRLPSAYDNRPLKFSEFEKYINQVIFVSATPAEYELKKSQKVVEQIIRPTGLVDPELEVRKTKKPVEDLVKEIKNIVKENERVLVTTLTKKMAEDLAEYLTDLGIRVRYLHSEIDTLQRVEILEGLRSGVFDVLVGVNLLREGLDLPEVSLVAILDADKEGFLRSQTSLIQTIGRAARNVKGKVILYAENITNSLKKAIEETERRRKIQLEYNKKYGITPETIKKGIRSMIENISKVSELPERYIAALEKEFILSESLEKTIYDLEKEMKKAAEELDFEKAIVLRDRIKKLKEKIQHGQNNYKRSKRTQFKKY
jgi:excinuclease ABC subunit B